MANASEEASEAFLLAIEAATPQASLALFRGAQHLTDVEIDAERSLCQGLLPAGYGPWGEADLPVPRLGRLAVSIGPGSSTGLGVGLATLKGLAFGSVAPVAAVPSLAALAFSAVSGSHPAGKTAAPAQSAIFVATLDAGRGEFYAACYDPGAWVAGPVLPESVYTPEELVARLPAQPIVLVTSEPARFQDLLSGRTGNEQVEVFDLRPRAGAVGELGLAMFQSGLAQSAEDLAPHYVRRAEAEARRTGQRLEASV